MLQARKKEVTEKFNALVLKANAMYGITLPDIKIRFDLTGKTAGQAYRKGSEYGVRFNTVLMQNTGWDHIINDTVPHELAHVVCYFAPHLGRKHNIGWKNICRRLGGTGQRCHNEDVSHADSGPVFMYTTTHGHVVPVGKIQHQRIQQGTTYTARNKGKLTKDCQYELKTANYVAPTVPAVNKTPTAINMPVAHTTPQQTPVRTGTNAEAVRARITLAKQQGEDALAVIQYAMTVLGMKRPLASTYVKNNWDKA